MFKSSRIAEEKKELIPFLVRFLKATENCLKNQKIWHR